MRKEEKVQQQDHTIIQKRIRKEVGKPIGLIKICLNPPNIWTNNQKEIQLISYFIKIGRHICIHQAVAHKYLNKKEAEYKQTILEFLKNEKEIYDQLEIVAKHLFEWKCSKRNVVYFFRNNINYKLNPQNQTLNTKQWNTVLKNIKFLLNEKFYNEFHMILEDFEQNYSNAEIGDKLIHKSLQVELAEIPQLVQNFFIKLIKKKKIQLKFTQFTINILEQIKLLFLNSLELYRNKLYKNIENLRTIMFLGMNSEILSKDTSQQEQNQDYEVYFNSTSY